jgi:hypothetical protein
MALVTNQVLCVSAEQVMSFAQLIFYSYMILFAFSPNITPIEWVVQIWQFIMMLEKVRDVSIFVSLLHRLQYSLFVS